MKFNSTSEMNLTKGNLFKKMFQFSLPLMLTSIFQLLYTTVDLWTVKTYGGGSLSMSAISSNGSLINLLITLLISLSLGSSVTMAVAKGSNDLEKAERIIHTSYIIAVIGGVIFGVVGFFVAPIILQIMDTPDSIIENASLYLRIYFLGIPFLAVMNFASQMLRSLGDSKRPMWILTISGLVNVLFDLLFVIVFKMDVAGVAVATVISWLVAAILLTIWFAKGDTVFAHFSFSKLHISQKEFKEILKIGIPAGLQGMAFSLPNILIQSSLYDIVNYSINGIAITPDEIVAGASAAGQIESYVFVMLDAFCVANVSFTGQNFGALNKENIKKCYWYSFIWILIFWAICCLICFTLYPQLFSIFINNDDKDIIKANAVMAGFERLKIMVVTYVLDAWMDLNGSYLKGMKKSVAPMIVTLIGCTGLRILFLLTIFTKEQFHTVFWLYAAFPISWILVNIAYIPIVTIIQKKQFKLIDKLKTTKNNGFELN